MESLGDTSQIWGNKTASSFFQAQKTFRKKIKRLRKNPEDLPEELQYAHLNPRVAAYLEKKEKEKKLMEELQTKQFDDGLGEKSLLTVISKKVSHLRNALNRNLPPDAESQKALFDEHVTLSESLLVVLGRYLDLFENKPVNIPKDLELELQACFAELIKDASYVFREWQLTSNREAEEAKKQEALLGRGAASTLSVIPSNMAGMSGSIGVLPGMELTPRGTKDMLFVDKDKKNREHSALKLDPRSSEQIEKSIKRNNSTEPAAKKASDVGYLANVNKDSGDHVGKSMENIQHPKLKSRKSMLPKAGATQMNGKKDNIVIGGTMDSIRMVGRSPSIISRRSLYARDDLMSVVTGSDSLPSVDKYGGYWSVIQFALSNKNCFDKGWVIRHLNEDTPVDKDQMMAFLMSKLQNSIISRKEQEDQDRIKNYISPLSRVYYGDVSRETTAKYLDRKRRRTIKSAPLIGKDLKPIIPRVSIIDEQDKEHNKKVFKTITPDGTTVTYYPSGSVAVVQTPAGDGLPGFYTLAYADEEEGQILANFTPSGRGNCNYENGYVSYLSTTDEGVQSNKEGAVVNRWRWPAKGGKLGATQCVVVNPFITVKIASKTLVVLIFTHKHDVHKFNIGAVPEANAPDGDAKYNAGAILTDYIFESNTAKLLIRRQSKQPKKHKKGKGKSLAVGLAIPEKGKHRSRSPSSASAGSGRSFPEIRKRTSKASTGFSSQDSLNKNYLSDIQRIANDMPEETMNDATADKILLRLKNKARNVTDDWMEHYRICLGLGSQYLQGVTAAASGIGRSSSSAKPGRLDPYSALDVSGNTAVPRPSLSNRVPSAPAVSLELSAQQDSPSTTYRLFLTVPSKNSPVKASPSETQEKAVEELPPRDMVATPQGSIERIRSAPPQRVVVTPVEDSWSFAAGVCPVALRQAMLGDPKPECRCRNQIPSITDIEFDEYMTRFAAPHQLVIVWVVSSIYPDASKADSMIEDLVIEKTRNRTQPCVQGRNEAFRILQYDMCSAAQFSNYTQPLLLRRHNAVPGMFMMYESGKLLFCDHIFNGYGNARKDFQKQIMETRRLSAAGKYLPTDFKFSPTKGRRGLRSAWGGEIGGAGVDKYASPGISVVKKPRAKMSQSSLSSDDSRGLPRSTSAEKFTLRMRCTSVGLTSPRTKTPGTTPRNKSKSPLGKDFRLPEIST